MRRAAEEEGLAYAAEAFADRGYAADGSLVSRKLDGSVILDPQRAAAQAVQIVTQGQLETADGRVIPLRADTLCLHGDNPNAEEIAWAVRQALGVAGVEVRALDR